MKAIIEPGTLDGTVMAQASKSMTQRAYAGALLHHGETLIHHVGYSDDENAALNIIRQLGARIISEGPHNVRVMSNGVHPISAVVACDESGLAARLFTPIAGLHDKELRIEGIGSLLVRPMNGFNEVLPALNVSVNNFNGYVPFSVCGPMMARSVKTNATESSQFLSGLLFALCACAKEPVTVEVERLVSKPYIDMTLEMLAHFGRPVKNDSYRSFYIDPASFSHKDKVEISVEGDWSGAACLLVAGAIAGDVTVRNLNFHSAQADRAIIDVLQEVGVRISMTDGSVTARKGDLRAFEFDATDCPDLFPPLAILATCCDGESSISGVSRLFHKESNRVESITEMLQRFGVPFSVENDAMYVTGVKQLQAAPIDGYNDHRIVMAAAVGALRAGAEVAISDVESVDKSYPDFFKDLVLCGAKCNFGI